jgi:signal transduction histidine kinase
MKDYQFNCNYALSVMGEKMIAIDTIHGKALWLSEKFNHTYPELNAESTIETIIDKICLSNKRKQLSKIITRAKNDDISSYRLQCDSYDIELYKIDDICLLIRLQDTMLVEEANSRYLEDREKLIFTARSVTVSEMASTIAHEINQPVGTINNLLHGIRERIITVDDHDKILVSAIDKSIEQAQYTADIICRIRDYTQKRRPKVKKLDINQLIDKCISLMDWEVRNTNVKICHYKLVDNAIIKGDELMLQQVIVNLVRNGIEAMVNGKKEIIITTKKDDCYIKIDIKDNGQGISSDDFENIFRPFNSNKGSGMGIGLNICRSFIEMHHGKIWLTQNNERGCTSHILLPTYNKELL